MDGHDEALYYCVKFVQKNGSNLVPSNIKEMIVYTIWKVNVYIFPTPFESVSNN